MKSRLYLAAVAVAAFFAQPTESRASLFTNIRIGDQDGFGYSSTAGLVRATGAPHTAPADTNGNGLLEQTEFLPDLNKNGQTATGQGDDFDNRSVLETGDSGGLFGSGFTDAGSKGFKWTDISLSTSFSGPNFPDPAGPSLANEPTFLFKFHVAGGDIVTGSTIFFNLIFGDYDVVPARVDLTFASSSRTINLMTQGGNQDGLIQAATSTLTFAEVFTADGSGGWNGFVSAKFVAPNEPFTAFDFAELSLDQIPFQPVPEPATFAMFALGAAGLVANGWKQRNRTGQRPILR